uniref:RHS repeat domain-containing protein n=1 Tax=Paenibacillus humicus TaxID=412861 RepID=UPI000FDA0394
MNTLFNQLSIRSISGGHGVLPSSLDLPPQYEYDQNGRLLKIHLYNGKEQRFIYDENRNLTKKYTHRID